MATFEPTRFSGGSQLVSTGDDFWRFAQMLLNGGALDGTRLLSPESVKAMTTARTDFPVSFGGWMTDQGFGLNVGIITDPANVEYPTSQGEYFWGGAANTLSGSIRKTSLLRFS